MRTQATRFNELVQFRAPPGFMAATTAAAQRDHTTVADFLRRTIIARLNELNLSLDSSGEVRR
jgi:hypothetical protein